MSGSLSRMIERVRTGRTDVMPRRASRYEVDEADHAAPIIAETTASPVAPRSATQSAEPARPSPAARADAPAETPTPVAEPPEPWTAAQAIVVRELQRITEATERRVEVLRTVADPPEAATPEQASAATAPFEPLKPRRAAPSTPPWPTESRERRAGPARSSEAPEPSTEPPISLEIGRIEIVSPARPARAPAPARRGPRLDLDSYLAARRKGER